MSNDLNRESDAWQEAYGLRAKANDLRQQADDAAKAAAEAEGRAAADEAGVEYEEADPLAGTWEGAVSGGSQESASFADAGEED